jgi:hypothetical protein
MNIPEIFFPSIFTVDPDYEICKSHQYGRWLIAQENFSTFFALKSLNGW